MVDIATHPMRMPTVHLNGSSRAALTDPLIDATKALYSAIEALEGASPNARDYYPQGPDAIREATSEHVARLQKLTSVRAELHAILLHISEQPFPGARS